MEGTGADQLVENAAESRSFQEWNGEERHLIPFSRGPQRQSEGWWKQNWE